MTDPKTNSAELNDDGTDNYLVGTVKLEKETDYTALWLKVSRAVVIRSQFTVLVEWLCVESSKVGLQGLVKTPYYVRNFPVVGVVPMSNAAQAETVSVAR